MFEQESHENAQEHWREAHTVNNVINAVQAISPRSQLQHSAATDAAAATPAAAAATPIASEGPQADSDQQNKDTKLTEF